MASKVNPLLDDKRLIEAILRCSPHNTGELESYHSSLNRNCPKNFCFSHNGMISRLV